MSKLLKQLVILVPTEKSNENHSEFPYLLLPTLLLISKISVVHFSQLMSP